MKNKVLNIFTLLAMVGMMFTACKKEYPEPPIQDLPIGTVYTIADILEMESGTVFNYDASVYGIVTADEQSGNLYKAAFIQDRATGAALELHLDAVSGVRIGDSIRVYLKDVTYSLYNNLPQLTDFEADGHIIILANNKPIEPAKATIAEINQGKYLAGLVRLENVRFTEQNTFADPSGYGNRTLADPTDYSQTVIVRTSNYANFANDSLPQGTGNLTAIASVYGSTWQLYIRSASELEFEGYVPGGDADLPYYQDFASSFGTYTTYDVKGAQHWEIDYNTAKMTGYANNTNYENEDWLISRRFSLEGVSQASMTMTYIARYFNDAEHDIKVLVSSDYTSGDPYSVDDWVEVSVPSWVQGTNWTDFASTTLDLSQFAGQKVCVAVKYESDNVKAGTIEVQSILIQEGSGPTPPPGPNPGGELQYMTYTQLFTDEFGTYTTYDVLGPQSWMIDYHTAKMTGYSGGSHANEDWLISSPVAITGVEHAKVAVTYSAQYPSSNEKDITLQVCTDYVYGNSPEGANWKEMSTPYPNTSSFNDFRTVETSLDEFIGQNVFVAIKYTSTDAQSRTIEIQSITVQEGEAGGDTPPGPTPGPGAGSGTQDDPYNVASGIGLQGQEIVGWIQGYIVGAVKEGNNSVSSNDQINWSAPFDLNTNVLIADDANCNDVALCVIVNLPNNKPLRTQVNLVDHPENLGKLLKVNGKLRTYFGQAGLRDSGGTENDFVLEGGDDPTPPPTPPQGIFSETFANGQGEFVIKDVNLSGLNYVWAYMNNYKCMKANGYYQGAHATESWLVSPKIDLSNVSTAKLSFDHAVAFAQAEGSFFIMVSTDYSGDVTAANWTALNIGAWPEPNPSWVFENATADLSAFAGQTINIAFKYTSTLDVCPAWEVKNVVVEE